MTVISDILVATGAFAAAFYCWVLARRLRRFSSLDKGVGGAVAVLSMQVDDLSKALEAAQASARRATEDLGRANDRAEDAARRLELLLASLHDLPEPAAPEPINPVFMRAASGGAVR